MKIRNVDRRGRVTLGAKFANKRVIVEDVNDTELRVTAVVVAKHEAWLYKNNKAIASVLRGLSQAKAKKFGR